METQQTPEEAHNTATADENYCFACGSKSKSHLRVVRRNSKIENCFNDLISILNVSDLFSESDNETFICESCIRLTDRVKSLERNCRNLRMNSKAFTNKSLIDHSPKSPTSKRTKTTDVQTNPTCRRVLHFDSQSNDLLICSNTSLIKLLSQCSVPLSHDDHESVMKSLSSPGQTWNM